MAGSTLDPDNLPAHPARKNQQAHDTRSLGPSDSSDSGSDLAGRSDKHNASDRSGTGERITVEPDQAVDFGGDIDTDRIVGPEDAGLGYGLDEAELARLDSEAKGERG